MARPPKNKAPAVDNAAASSSIPPPPRQIDVEGFVRVRDSVYSRLISIQNLIQSFSVDYLRQTNLLLGFGEGGPGDNAVDFASLEGIGNLMPAGGLAPLPAEEPKKERKKRQHDPNAPKRPLTPYFLYMQTARPIIAADLGSDAAKGAVQEEGQRRWGTMSQAEKAGWDQAYQYNLRLYNARVHSYKHGNPNAKEMTDDEAQQYAEAHNIPMPTGKDVAAAAVDIGNDQDAIAQQLQGAVVDEQEESEEQPEEEEEQPESPPAAKTPKSTGKKGAAGKRKSAAAAEPPTPAPQESTTKKRKRQSKAAEEKPEPEPKKSGRNKKAKSG